MPKTLALLLLLPCFALAEAPLVTAMRCPNDGIQPQAAVDSKGRLHVVYLTGDSGRSDVFYIHSADAKNWSTPLRVNSQPGAAIAAGTVRGAQLAIGKGDRVHVSWMGSKDAQPAGPNGAMPMLYARLNDKGDAFEDQRNLIVSHPGLDGGGSVAADDAGNVYVAWHAPTPGKKGEENRQVWVAVSKDDGKTFAEETLLAGGTGVCGCCAMKIAVDPQGTLLSIYRAANERTRDLYLAAKGDPANIAAWPVKTCPMSTIAMLRHKDRVVAAWETDDQVYIGLIENGRLTQSAAAPGKGKRRKHPSVAVNAQGRFLLAWDENTAWKKGGDIHWQLFTSDLKPAGNPGAAPNMPAWSLPATLPTKEGFLILY